MHSLMKAILTIGDNAILMVYLMTNMSPSEFETVNYSQTETKLNSVKRCKTSQFLIELTNLVAAVF